MGKLALIVAFFSCGFSSLFPLFYNMGLTETVSYPDRLLCLPALILGLKSWCRTWSFSRNLPVIACFTLFTAGVLITENSEQGRGMLVFAGVAAAIPISALMIELKTARLCAQVFVIASILNMAILLLFSGGFSEGGRFGLLTIDDVQVSNPNGLAAQIGLAAVLTMALTQRQQNVRMTDHDKDVFNLSCRDVRLLALLVFFGIGILMSASRGAIITLLAVFMMLLMSARTKIAYRVLLGLALLIATLLVLYTDNDIVSRFRDTKDLADVGNRLPIWQASLEIMSSEPENLWYGVGTGGADKSLAEFLPREHSFRVGEDGISRRATHNTYVEWALSHGLIGIPFGLWLIFSATRASVRLDRIDRSTDRRSLLAFCAIISMSTVLYRATYVTALCALFLTMLSGPFLAKWPTKKSRSLKHLPNSCRLNESTNNRFKKRQFYPLGVLR